LWNGARRLRNAPRASARGEFLARGTRPHRGCPLRHAGTIAGRGPIQLEPLAASEGSHSVRRARRSHCEKTRALKATIDAWLNVQAWNDKGSTSAIDVELEQSSTARWTVHPSVGLNAPRGESSDHPWPRVHVTQWRGSQG